MGLLLPDTGLLFWMVLAFGIVFGVLEVSLDRGFSLVVVLLFVAGFDGGEETSIFEIFL